MGFSADSVTPCVSARTAGPNDRTITAAPMDAAKPAVAVAPRNTFTVSYARFANGSAPSSITPTHSRDDMELQLESVRQYRAALHAAFVNHYEAVNASFTESDRRTAARLLIREAARSDIAIARRNSYEEPVVQYMKGTWAALGQQAEHLLSGNPAVDGDVEAAANECRSRVALENISSMGLWFSGANISLPLRRYAVQVPCDDGSVQNVVVVGVVSFTYSSYVMQLRQASQQAVLAALQEVSHQVGACSLFLPPLLVEV